MQTEVWHRTQEIFDGAVERDAATRVQWVEEQCGSNSDLQAEVLAMLAADVEVTSRGEDFIQTVIAEGAALLDQDPTDPLVRQGRFGKYQILEKIGQGGFGKVYRGLDPVLGRSVAVKTCESKDERLRRRFLREAKIAAGLQHPNIVTVHDFGYENDVPYLVQEYLSGEDLVSKIMRQDSLPLELRLDYLTQICRGLEHAHLHGVLHRDVKPANLRVLDDGQLRVLDFGIARLMDQTSALTSDGVAMGTVGYLAPEQLSGGDVDARTDIFSFGVVAYELMCHQRPFQGDTFSRVSYQLLYEDPPDLRLLAPDCPPALVEIIETCLCKLPKARYESFTEIIQDLERLVDDSAASLDDTRPTIRLQNVKRRRLGRRLGWAGAVAVVLVALCGLWWALQRPTAADPATPAALATPDAGQPSARESLAGNESAAGLAAGDANGQMAALPSDNAGLDGLPEASRGPVSDVTQAPSAQTPVQAAGKVQSAARNDAEESAARSDEARRAPADDARQVPVDDARRAPVDDARRAPATEPSPSSELVDGAVHTAAGDVPASDVPSGTQSDASVAPGADPSVPSDDPDAPAANPSASGTSELIESIEPAETTNPGAGSTALPEAITEPEPEVVEIVPPQLLSQVPAQYPPLARRRRIEAQVVVGVRVDEQGTVIRTLLKSSSISGMGFEEAAKEAARQSRFRPGSRGGEPVAQWTEIVFEFRLE